MREIFFGHAVNEALREELARDERVYVVGTDVRQGAFGVTSGLVKDFGPRIVDTPICESAFVSATMGMAMNGLVPVVEVMFADMMYCAMDIIANQIAQYRYMTGGQVELPLVIRTVGGAGLSVGYNHSQCTETTFLGIPGLIILAPSNPYDAKGLLKAAIRNPNPVLYYEHRLLYAVQGPVPAEEYTLPIGQAEVKRAGRHVTVVAVQSMVARALAAAAEVAGHGIEVEVIDPRTLIPLDLQTIMTSVKKTGRLVIAEESRKRHGFGAMLSAAVVEAGLDLLEAAPVRVAAPDVPVPSSFVLEQAYIPSTQQIVAAVQHLMGVQEGPGAGQAAMVTPEQAASLSLRRFVEGVYGSVAAVEAERMAATKAPDGSGGGADG